MVIIRLSDFYFRFLWVIIVLWIIDSKNNVDGVRFIWLVDIVLLLY